MYDIILSFITAFTISYLAIPSIINIAHKKGLIDEPDERTSHSSGIPTLGGIGIFAGMIFSVIMWTPFSYFADLQYILCSVIIIFLIGAKDDIDPISPGKKMLGQLFAAFILVLKANIKLTSLYGIFGIYAIPEFWSVVLSVFTIIVIINSFNLIDGINGLSGSIGTLIAVVLGSWFFLVDRLELAILAYSLAGSTIAFLKFNFTPAKIFMGDTGSLLLGLICSILTISFIEFHQIIDSPYAFKAAPSVAFGIMILPLFDTLRVFIMRILKGKSPFRPDRQHIHHLLIDAGMSHMQATGTLLMVNILFIFIVIKLQGIGNMNLFLLVLGLALILSSLLFYISSGRKRNRLEQL